MKTTKFLVSLLTIPLLLNAICFNASAQYPNNAAMNISKTLGLSSWTGSMQPVRKFVNQYGNCYAFAPADWGITGTRQEGDALDMFSADRNSYAGYLIVGVQGNLTTGYYGQTYGTPERYLHTILSNNGNNNVSYGEPVRDGFGYTILPFELGGTAGVKGVVFYKVWSVPGDPYGYIMAIRTAKTVKNLWKSKGSQAVSVALSIRSVVQFQSGGNYSSGNTEEKKVESEYNVQLGMEYVHDPDTGENYWVNPAKDYDETGLYGPGYYKHTGNDIKKLVPGRSDD